MNNRDMNLTKTEISENEKNALFLEEYFIKSMSPYNCIKIGSLMGDRIVLGVAGRE